MADRLHHDQGGRGSDPAPQPPARPTVAVVGASEDRGKFGNKAVRAFVNAGYTVYPIHPTAGVIEGLTAYASLDALPVDTLDCVTFYVPPAVGAGLLEQVARKQAGELWLNPGSDGPEVVRRAEELGLPLIRACSILGVGQHPARL